VDETYIKIKKVWMYLYRAVDSEGNTLEFLLRDLRIINYPDILIRNVLDVHEPLF
jgi:transposase-like protein